MNQGYSLTRPICARNSGFALLLRATIGSIILLSLNMILEVPGDSSLTAAIFIKSNIGLLILFGLGLLVLAFLTLVVSLPVHNVLMHMNKKLSYRTAILRLTEGFVFVIGIIILFLEVPAFEFVLLFTQGVFAVYLLSLGLLVYRSSFLHEILGILLMIGGLMGYSFAFVTRFIIPSLALISSGGVAIAFIAEVALGFTLLLMARSRLLEEPDPKDTITNILRNMGDATTKEILEEASMVSDTCQDRIPRTLSLMEQEKVITKELSKEKKGYIWRLVE